MTAESQSNFAPPPPGTGQASARARTGCIAALIIIGSLVCWFNYRLHFNGFLLNDYHEYCQIGRNIHDGNGYSTSVLRPIAYRFFKTLPQPEVTRMPGYPYALAAFFAIFGVGDDAVIIANSVFFVLLLILVFLLGVELSGDLLTGFMAALMTAAMESFLVYALTAEPNIMYAALFAGFFILFLKMPERLFLHGVLLAVLYLVRANTLFVMIGLVAALFLHQTSWRARLLPLLLVPAGFAAGLIPYMIRNYAVVGKPFFSLYKYSLLLFTAGFPQYTVWTQVTDVDPTAYVLSHPAEIALKAMQFLQSLLSGSIPFYKPLVLLLVGAGLLLPLQDTRLRLLRSILLCGIAAQTLLVAPLGPVPYYYMFFFPLLIALILANVRPMLDRFAPLAFSAALAVFVITTIPLWRSAKPANVFRDLGQQVRSLTEKSDIVLTDIPWELAWYADRRTVWLPYDLKTLQLISTTLKPRYVLLTGQSYAAYGDNTWEKMILDAGFAEKVGYRVSGTVLSGNLPIAVLYRAVE